MDKDDKQNRIYAAKAWAAVIFFPFSLPWIIAATKDKTDRPEKTKKTITDEVASTVAKGVGCLAVIVIFFLLVAVCSS